MIISINTLANVGFCSQSVAKRHGELGRSPYMLFMLLTTLSLLFSMQYAGELRATEGMVLGKEGL